MKKFIFLLTVFAVICLPVFAKGDKFFILNDTELLDFTEIYVCDADDKEWGRELLDGDILSAGKSQSFVTEYHIKGSAAKGAYVDVLVIDENGSTYTIYNWKFEPDCTIIIDDSDIDT